jgi:SAM-dependent methyltransferase
MIRNFIRKSLNWVTDRSAFRRQLQAFRNQADVNNQRLSVTDSDLYPIYGEATAATNFDRHYVYHTAWAARVLAITKPADHHDISSSLYFAAIASAFCPIHFYDFRPPELSLSSLVTNAGDVNHLPFENESIVSLSCMHVIEHIGLGRYGDAIDYDGDLKAIDELRRVVKKNGDLLFVVPVGKPRIQFNAHRIYSYEQIIEYFPDFSLQEFALIPDSPETGGLMPNPPPELVSQQTYACGCFWLRKK